MLRQLRLRLTLLAAALTGAVVVAALGVAFSMARAQYLRERAAAFAAAVAQVQYQWTTYGAVSDSWLADAEQNGGLWLQLAENGSPLLFSARKTADQTALFGAVWDEAAARGVDRAVRPVAGLSAQEADFTLDYADAAYRCAVRTGLLRAGGWHSLAAVQPTAAEQAYLARLAHRFVLLGMAGCAVITMLCWFVAGRAIRPAAAAMDAQQRFVSDAGHELRTPLAVIRANAGAAAARPENAAQYLHVIDAESARMGALVDDLLLLSAGASARGRLDLQPLAPDTFLLQFAEDMEPVAAGRGRHLRAELPPQAVPPVRADAHRLRQLLTVLLDNALRYEPAGGTVLLRLTAPRGAVRFAVIDHGPGVPDAEKRKIFERFYRAQNADRAGAHYGLGLSVARELAALHGAKLRAEDTPGGGATFILELRA